MCISGRAIFNVVNNERIAQPVNLHITQNIKY